MLETPILFLIFNRPEQTRQVFEEIRKQQPKYLCIAGDGPRHNQPLDYQLCEEARNIVSQIDWDCDVKTLFRKENLGSKYAVSLAITWFFEEYEAGIILEDDCLPNESFFTFTNTLLKRFEHEEKVMMITGCSFQPNALDANSYYFSKYVHVWGWATWKRAWSLYNVSLGKESETDLNNLIKETFKTKKEQQRWKYNFSLITEGLDAWDYQWMYWIWKNKGVTVIPWQNMISNIGFGADATHTFDESSDQSKMKLYQIKNINHPTQIAVNINADFIERFKIIIPKNDQSFMSRVKAKVKILISSLRKKHF